MKSKLINLRVTPAEHIRWQEALKLEGRTISEVCRAALDRAATRIEKKGASGDKA